MQNQQGITGSVGHGGYEIRHRTTVTDDGRFSKAWLNLYRGPVGTARVAAVMLLLEMPIPWPQTPDEELALLRRRSDQAVRYIRAYIDQGRIEEGKVHEISILHGTEEQPAVVDLNDVRYQ